MKDRQRLAGILSLAVRQRANEPQEVRQARAQATHDGFMKGLVERVETSPHEKARLLAAHEKRMRKADRFTEELASEPENEG